MICLEGLTQFLIKGKSIRSAFFIYLKSNKRLVNISDRIYYKTSENAFLIWCLKVRKVWLFVWHIWPQQLNFRFYLPVHVVLSITTICIIRDNWKVADESSISNENPADQKTIVLGASETNEQIYWRSIRSIYNIRIMPEYWLKIVLTSILRTLQVLIIYTQLSTRKTIKHNCMCAALLYLIFNWNTETIPFIGEGISFYPGFVIAIN